MVGDDLSTNLFPYWLRVDQDTVEIEDDRVDHGITLPDPGREIEHARVKPGKGRGAMEGPEVMAGRLTGITEQLTVRGAPPAGAGGLSHAALLYRDDGEYRAGLAEFARAAVIAGAPVQMVLPAQR